MHARGAGRSAGIRPAREETMAVKVGINGFGRIGRNIMRAALGSKDLDFVAVQRPDQRQDPRAHC
jgi:lactate dehydrogenase-like 2-hydroxyacid dehydrogenase